MTLRPTRSPGVRTARGSPPSSTDQTVTIWEVGTWREVLSLDRHSDFAGEVAGADRIVVWTPDGRRVAAGTARGWFIMWDVTTGREVLGFKAHTAQIRSIAISPDGLRLATASVDRSVKIWDMAGRQLLTLRGHDGGAHSVAWSPSGEWLVSSGGVGLKRLKLWGRIEGGERYELTAWETYEA